MDSRVESLSKLVTGIIREMVNVPEEVSLNVVPGTETVIFEASVAKEDVSKLIGRQGRNVSSLRTIVNACAAKYKLRVVLNVMDDR